jgi:hypothetical protein
MHAVRTGQIRWVAKGDPDAQRQIIHTIFGVSPRRSDSDKPSSPTPIDHLQQNPTNHMPNWQPL